MASWRQVDDCGYLHTGDVAHRLYSGLRTWDPPQVARIWEEEGTVVAWAFVYPSHKAFDLQRAPGRDDLVDTAAAWAEARLAELVEGLDHVATDVYGCDQARHAALTARGYERGRRLFVVTTRPVTDPPDARPPAGFVIRNAEGVEEAARLAAVHTGAFGSDWTAEGYRRRMQAPDYDPRRELVAVAPDGRFAAFCILWFDPLNRVGLFEPVGTHEEFRRRGLGRALLVEGLRRMAAAGMELATVMHRAGDEPAQGLYTAVGFEPIHEVNDYARRAG